MDLDEHRRAPQGARMDMHVDGLCQLFLQGLCALSEEAKSLGDLGGMSLEQGRDVLRARAQVWERAALNVKILWQGS